MRDDYPKYYVSAFIWHKGDDASDGEYIPETLYEATNVDDAFDKYNKTHPSADSQHIELWMETEDDHIRLRYKDSMSDGTVCEEIEEV